MDNETSEKPNPSVESADVASDIENAAELDAVDAASAENGVVAAAPEAEAAASEAEPVSESASDASLDAAKTIPLDPVEAGASNAPTVKTSPDASASEAAATPDASASEVAATPDASKPKGKPVMRKADSASKSKSTAEAEAEAEAGKGSAATEKVSTAAEKSTAGIDKMVSDVREPGRGGSLRTSLSERDLREASVDERKKRFRKERRDRAIRRTIIILILVAIIGTIGGFCTIHWFSYNDKESIQGTWRIEGTNATVVITDETITLTEGVAYDYEMDPDGKNLVFSFGGLQGDARYRFSINHDELCLQDGTYEWFGTLLEDIPWTFQAAIQYLTGGGQKSPSFGEGSMVLERVA